MKRKNPYRNLERQNFGKNDVYLIIDNKNLQYVILKFEYFNNKEEPVFIRYYTPLLPIPLEDRKKYTLNELKYNLTISQFVGPFKTIFDAYKAIEIFDVKKILTEISLETDHGW